LVTTKNKSTMDYSDRFNQIESLLADLLKSHDRQNEILKSHSEILKNHSEILNGHGEILKGINQTLNSQTRLFELLNDKIDRFDENRKMDVIHLEGSLARIENALNLIGPMLEKAVDQDIRIRKLEEAVFKKGA